MMIETSILTTAVVIFSLRTILFVIGAYLERRFKPDGKNKEYLPFVSIIIPARNEEDNIERCVKSISANTYPSTQYEIIAVNDRSTDNTGLVLEKIQSSYPNLKVVTITEETAHKNLKGKPGALQAGIDNAEGSIILMTDADCTQNPNWIETMTRYYADPEVSLVASFTNVNGSGLFEKIQSVEWTYMHTMACAGIGLKQPLGCFGNNLSVRADDFRRLGGYEKIKFSVTEDLALLSTIFLSGKKVHYASRFDSSVDTLPCSSFKEYISQKRRWAIGGLDLGWRAAIFVLSSLSLWTGAITSIICGDLYWFTAILGIRLLGDFFLIFPSLVALKRKELGIWIFPSIFFFMFMELLVPILILNRKTTWKGQVFKR